MKTIIILKFKNRLKNKMKILRRPKEMLIKKRKKRINNEIYENKNILIFILIFNIFYL
jgi:hypothetical protein